MSWVGRQPSSAASSETAVRSTSSGAPRRQMAGSTVRRPGGRARRRRTSAPKAAEAAASGSSPSEQEVPDVLQGALLGQLDRRVLPVVEEALLTAHVADRRLGHDHALEPGRDLAAGLVRRAGCGPRP